jgi:hypothetical protein
MPGEGILQIGATVDKTGVDAGLAAIQEGTRSVVQSIAVQVEETTARTKAAWNKLGVDVKAAAQSVSAESLKVAEATKAQAAALADLRRASVLTHDANIGEAESTAILAAAQTKVASASAQVAAAKVAEAESIAQANLKSQLSENALVASFQRANAAIGVSLAGLRERLVLTGETAHFSAREIATGFSGLGELLGAGLLVGFAAHFLDETAKMELELGHLHEKTKIAVADLAGFEQLVRQSGEDWDAISLGVVRMEKNLADSVEPTKQLTDALAGIGLKIDDLRAMKPEDKLQAIAIALSRNANAGNQAAAAIALFGRGGQALIPILVSQGAALRANITAAGKLTGVTEESIDAAVKWQESTARLTTEFRSVMVPAIEIVEKAIAAVLAVIKAVDAAIWTLIDALGALAKTAGVTGRVVFDAMTGNWNRLRADTASLTSDLETIWSNYGSKVAQRWKETAALLTWSPKGAAKEEASVDLGDPTDRGGEGGKPKGIRGGVLDADMQALDALKLDHEVTLEEEISFWQKRLAAVRKGSDEYKAIVAKLAPLMQRELKKPQDSGDQRSVDLSGITIPEDELSRAVKANNDAVKQTVDADRFGAEEKMRIAAEEYRDIEENTAFEVRMGRMSAEQRLRVLRQAALEEQRIRQQQSQFIQMLDLGDTRRYMQDLRQEEQAARQSARTIEQINQQSALNTSASWKNAYSRMTEEFSRNVSMWVSGQQTLAQSWAKTLRGITDTVVQNLAKQAAAYITNAATQDAVDQRQKLKDAAAAARGAFKAVVGIPIVGPFLAPVAAAAAFAAVEAFEQGGVVNGQRGMGVPILAHAGERVLTPGQTENFHKLVNQTTNSASSSQKLEMHLQQNIHAYDRSGMRNTLRAHADDLMDIVQDGIRAGKLKYA